MGLLGLLSSAVSGFMKGGSKSSSASWLQANKFNKSRGGHAGGYGAWTFQNIIDAHSSSEEIVEEFGLDREDCEYIHPEFDVNCYHQAWMEEYEKAVAEAMALSAATGGIIEIDPEDLMNQELVETNAGIYADDLADMYINGDTWIPRDIIDWAYYDVSDHNNR